MKNPRRLPKEVVPVQSCRLFPKFKDMVDVTVVKIVRRAGFTKYPRYERHELDALAEKVLGYSCFSWKVFTILRLEVDVFRHVLKIN